jgi:hypothetical protein
LSGSWIYRSLLDVHKLMPPALLGNLLKSE